jgi:hypothetical protein
VSRRPLPLDDDTRDFPPHFKPSSSPPNTMKKSVWRAFQDQWSTIPPVANADLTGQTVVVVGATTGIGFEAAKHFGRMGPTKPILACRNEEKGRAAASSKRPLLSTQCLARLTTTTALRDTRRNGLREDRSTIYRPGEVCFGSRFRGYLRKRK